MDESVPFVCKLDIDCVVFCFAACHCSAATALRLVSQIFMSSDPFWPKRQKSDEKVKGSYCVFLPRL